MEHFRIIEATDLNDHTKHQLSDLWNSEYPENIAYESLLGFNEYLEKLDDQFHLLLINSQNEVVGWAFSFERDNERWFAIIISAEVQGRGFGRKMLDQLKLTETELNGWVIPDSNYRKINGMEYRSPLDFYRKCNFEVLANTNTDFHNIHAVKIKWSKV